MANQLFQHLYKDLGQWPRLVWAGPLALKPNRCNPFEMIDLRAVYWLDGFTLAEELWALGHEIQNRKQIA